MMEDFNLYDKIRRAAEKKEAESFDGLENVWNRVSDRLDNTQLKRENTTWKYIAAAACLLLLSIVGYEFFSDKGNMQPSENNIVVHDSITRPEMEPDENRVVQSDEVTNPVIKQEAPQLLEKQITDQQAVAVNESLKPAPIAPPVEKILSESVAAEEIPMAKESSVELMLSKQSGETAPAKKAPLVVIDGKVAAKDKHAKKKISYTTSSEVEQVIELKEPLYIINGVEYSEESLFGPKPTSPYAPLDQQEIESITAIQPAEAVPTYGKKGEKGVVIIITKNRKPASGR